LLPVHVMLCNLKEVSEELEGYTVAYTTPSPAFGPEWVVYRGYFAVCTPGSMLSHDRDDLEKEADIRAAAIYAVKHTLGRTDTTAPWVSELGGQAWDIASRMGWPVCPVNPGTPLAFRERDTHNIAWVLPPGWETLDRLHRRQKLLVSLTKAELSGDVLRFPEFIADNAKARDIAQHHASKLLGSDNIKILTPYQLELEAMTDYVLASLKPGYH